MTFVDTKKTEQKRTPMEHTYEMEEGAINEEIDALQAGTHKGYLKKIKELDEAMEQRGKESEKWKEFQIQNIQHIFEAESKQAQEECEVITPRCERFLL